MGLTRPELYINRELSQLEFNRRVLEQTKDESVPLFERLRFLCIASTNLDEFFEIRVAGLKQQVAHGAAQSGPDNLSPTELLKRISEIAHAVVSDQYRVLNEILLPRLAEQQIHLPPYGEWEEKLNDWVGRYFNRELLPVLSPFSLDPGHPFPRILNKSLNFMVALEGKDAFGRNSGTAIVQAPRSLPRIIGVPPSYAGSGQVFVLLSSIIQARVGDLFPGMKVIGCYAFRVTRDSELFVDEEEVDDLLRALEGELPGRRFGDAVRIEVADDCPPEMVSFLTAQFNLSADDIYQVHGPVNLSRLQALYELVERPDLKYAGFTPALPRHLSSEGDIFEYIRNGDILLHHPFQSFAPVVDFLRQAAHDPRVLAIRQTLYRTGVDSTIVQSLVEAARQGKEVTVVIELRARFDEEANIELASQLQEAGAHVVYGVVGYKTHTKLALVVRREDRALRRYVHVGTGNYHLRTARTYTDFGLLSCNSVLAEDVQRVFQQLTSLGRASKLKLLLQSPFTLHKTIVELIQQEATLARQGKAAHIMAKMNALTESNVIRALYEASQTGVKIDLVVRGICVLRPGVAGISENIQVRSVVGRFLEHARIFYFHNNDQPRVYLSSADWMERNFFRRVEVALPIEDRLLRERVVREGLNSYLNDNTQSWLLQSDGSYKHLTPGAHKPRSAQQHLLDTLSAS